MTHDPNFLPPDLQERIIKAGFPEKDCVFMIIRQHNITDKSFDVEYEKKITWTAAMVWLQSIIDESCMKWIEIHSDGESGINSIDLENQVFGTWYEALDHALKIVEDAQK